MSKSIVLVVHGIGEHTEANLKKTVIDAANEALSRYDDLKGMKYEDYVDVIPVVYDDIFEKERKKIADNSNAILDIIKDSNLGSTDLFDKLAKVSEDNTFNTHILDILFYAGMRTTEVRSRVIGILSEKIGFNPSRKIHVITHSMGTAVAHDILAKAYGTGIKNQFDADNKNADKKSFTQTRLFPDVHKLDSIWMFANTSQLFYDYNPLKTNVDPHKSIVRPKADNAGCTLKYFNVCHKYDIIGKAVPFEPPKAWNRNKSHAAYVDDIKTENFYKTINPHSLYEYIINPCVSHKFLRITMPTGLGIPTAPPTSELPSLNKEAQKFIDLVDNADSISDFVDLIKVGSEFLGNIPRKWRKFS